MPMDLRSKTPAEGLFQSNAAVHNLQQVENQLARLAPPKWPEDVFGPIDRAKAQQGKALFMTSCAGCHNAWPYAWTEPNKYGKRFVLVGLVPQTYVGTDPGQFRDLRPFAITGQLGDYLPPPFRGKDIIPTGALYLALQGQIARSGALPTQADRCGGCRSARLIESFRFHRRRSAFTRRRRAMGFGPPRRSCTTGPCPTCTRC